MKYIWYSPQKSKYPLSLLSCFQSCCHSNEDTNLTVNSKIETFIHSFILAFLFIAIKVGYTGQTFNVYFFLVQVYIFDTNRVIQAQTLKDIKLRKLVKQNVCNVGIRPKIYENLLTVTKTLPN